MTVCAAPQVSEHSIFGELPTVSMAVIEAITIGNGLEKRLENHLGTRS